MLCGSGSSRSSDPVSTLADGLNDGRLAELDPEPAHRRLDRGGERVGRFVPDSTWHRHLEELAPMTAGLAIQATTGLHNLPISPWAGIGVLAGWAAAALLAGGILLRLRDA
jgi:hypothetical protein